MLWPRAPRLTLAPKWKTCTARQPDVETLSSVGCLLGKTRRGVLGPPFRSDYPSPRSLLKNHLLYVTVIDDTKIVRARLSHQSTPTDIILSLRGQTYTRTNTLATHSQIVSRDVTPKVQTRLRGCCGQKTSQFSIVNIPGEMLLLSLFV